MNRLCEHELLTRWYSVTTTEGLRHVGKMIGRNSPRIIRREFEDGEGGRCLASWFGHHLGISGPEFLIRAGLPEISEVVFAWDTDPKFPAQLLKSIRKELFYREGVHRGWDERLVRDDADRAGLDVRRARALAR